MLKTKHRYLVAGAWSLFLGSCVSGPLSAEDYPLVGTWVVDFKKTAESLDNEDQAKGFLNASQGIKLEMVYRPDGSVVFTKYFGDESESYSGKYKIDERDGDEFVMEVMTPRKGIRFEQIYQAPQEFIDEHVVMIGTFREHYPKSESFGLAQGDLVLEVFYEKLSAQQKASIDKQQQGAEAPVAVQGILGKSSIKDDEVYFIEAKGIHWGSDVMETHPLKVKLIDENHCQMDALGLGMRFIWQRIN
jgi:hypothetical protein